MFKKILTMVVLAMSTAFVFAQAPVTHTYPALDTFNPFTGSNEFPFLNTDYNVGFPPLTSIAAATTAACANVTLNHSGRVIIPAGITPPDAISAAPGCSNVSIVDYSAYPWACYTWSGSGPYASVNCSSGGGGSGSLSGMTGGQIPLAATSSTVTSSVPLAGTISSGYGIMVGTRTSANGDIPSYLGGLGQTADSLLNINSIVTLSGSQVLLNKSISGSQINSGVIASAQLPSATTSIFGVVKPDGSTITISGGVISAVSGNASFPSSGTPCVPWATSTTVSTCLTLTTTGSSGAATLTGATLNIPQYSGGSSGFPIVLGATSVAASSTTTAVTGLSVNGVTLTTGGGTTNFLRADGTYAAPPGFANVMTTLGDLMYGGASGAPTRLAGFTVAGTYNLCEIATGIAVAPTWCNSPITKTVVTSNFLTGYSSTTGLFTAAQPAFTDISGQASLAQLPTLSANTVLGAVTATTPSGLAIPSCSATGDALNWTSGTGFGCFTGYAPLASPTFTGIPAAPTAAANTNTTQLATTAYVVGQAGTATPLINGSAAVGTSLLYARQDHIHPTDTTRAPVASPTFTGTVTTPALTLSTVTGSTQCLQANTSGVVSGTGTACGSSGGGITALTGDVTASGSGSVVATVVKVNGVSYGTSPSTNTVPVVTGTNTVTYEAVPNAALVNAATTVNSQTCTLGSTCTVTAVPSGSAGGALTGSYPNPTIANLGSANFFPMSTGSGALTVSGCFQGSDQSFNCPIGPTGAGGAYFIGSFNSNTGLEISNTNAGNQAASGMLLDTGSAFSDLWFENYGANYVQMDSALGNLGPNVAAILSTGRNKLWITSENTGGAGAGGEIDIGIAGGGGVGVTFPASISVKMNLVGSSTTGVTFPLLSGAGGLCVDATNEQLAICTAAQLQTNLGSYSAHQFLGNNTGSSATPSPSLLGTNDWSPNAYVVGAGSVNVMTATLAPAATALMAGLQVDILPNLANTTTTPTLNVNGLGAKTITKNGTTALAAGDYTTTAIAEMVYDGTEWQLINPQTSGGGSSAFSALTSSTNTTAAMVVGTGASLAASGSGTITATAVPASGLTGATLASGVTASSLTSLGGGTVGTAAFVNTGTSLGTVCLLNTNCTSSGSNTFSGVNIFGTIRVAEIDSTATTTGILMKTQGGGPLSNNTSIVTLGNSVTPSSLSFSPSSLSVVGTYTLTGTYTGSPAAVLFANTIGTGSGNVYNGSTAICQLCLEPTVNLATSSTGHYSTIYSAVTQTLMPSVTNYNIEMPNFTVTLGGTGLFSGTVTSALGNAPISSATGGTGVTSVTCATAACTVSRGSYTVVGGTATTGTIITLVWPTTITPWVCSTDMNGGTGFLGIGHGVATATGMNITAGLTVVGVTFTVDYNCVP